MIRTPVSLPSASSVKIYNSVIEAKKVQGNSQYSGTIDYVNALDVKNLTIQNTSLFGDGNITAIKVGYNSTLDAQNILIHNFAKGIQFTGGRDDSLNLSSSSILGVSGYILENLSNKKVTAMDNFWGTTDLNLINLKIWDYNDDLNRGIVEIQPVVSQMISSVPISSVTNVIKKVEPAGMNISWDVNPENDIAGYRVHYGSPTGYSYANVVDVGNSTSYTLAGVDFNDSIAVTAYDSGATSLQQTSTVFENQTNGSESWFSNAVLVMNAPVITSHPANKSVYTGESVTLSISVGGSGLSYQWYKNGIPISGANSNTYYFSNITLEDSGNYSVLVSNSAGSITSNEGVLNVLTFDPSKISGVIVSDTTWKLTESQYTITGDVGVAEGAKLTIEPGVVVNFAGDYEILINGVLNANGNESSKIRFNGNFNGSNGGPTLIKFKKSTLGNSLLNHVIFENANYALRIGRETEHSQGDKNTGQLKVENCQFIGADILTDGYATDASLLLVNAEVNGSTIKGSYPRSEFIEIRDSKIVDSIIFSDSYNKGIKLVNCIVIESDILIEFCGANLDI